MLLLLLLLLLLLMLLLLLLFTNPEEGNPEVGEEGEKGPPFSEGGGRLNILTPPSEHPVENTPILTLIARATTLHFGG